MSTLIWRFIAIISTLLALIGVFLPILPTTPFILVAAWAASHGWESFEVWLLKHPRFGPLIKDWRTHRCIPRYAKWISSCMMLLSVTFIIYTQSVSVYLKVAIVLMLVSIAIWIWSKPENKINR